MSDPETIRRLTALAAMLSRGAPLPSDFPSVIPDPTPTRENRLHAQEMASVGIPEEVVRPPERRNAKPVEQMPDGTWKKQGYSRRKRVRDLSNWDEPIN